MTPTNLPEANRLEHALTRYLTQQILGTYIFTGFHPTFTRTRLAVLSEVMEMMVNIDNIEGFESTFAIRVIGKSGFPYGYVSYEEDPTRSKDCWRFDAGSSALTLYIQDQGEEREEYIGYEDIWKVEITELEHGGK